MFWKSNIEVFGEQIVYSKSSEGKFGVFSRGLPFGPTFRPGDLPRQPRLRIASARVVLFTLGMGQKGRGLAGALQSEAAHGPRVEVSGYAVSAAGEKHPAKSCPNAVTPNRVRPHRGDLSFPEDFSVHEQTE
jgi:hypothetical protein